ncbi:hypothetical protein N7508_011190 [Penicillium antarcticum]|uniref:uncharacterized protein n=1 Tax=Penicillium antarcticum TaxID=416450 RepID=UPI002394B34B|nr:uncharacterized protein N7508_011190 [Penicillium antarcticum]KAJ5288415.1 hypothetical protein N7508_011190 [Penicillium antarcticum]
MGMFTPGSIPGRIIRFNKDHKVHIEDAISFLQEKYRPSIILVILSANAKKLGNIARLAYDVTYGIPAIELTHELLANSNQNWYARVGLMINLKLGGENHMVNSSDLSFFASGKTMIIGTNVAFARSASQGYFYTIAGLMVSSDSRLARWPAEIRVQHGKEPHIHKLNEMLETRIHSWAKKHGNKLPEDIVVYRNSEGEHEPWVEKEVCLIKDACRAAKLTVQDNLPRITVVLVDENYGAQLLPTADTECHRSGSPLAGTVVDRGLTVPRQWDFFLRSHNSTQGLNGPTRYFVVFDEVFRRRYRVDDRGRTPVNLLQDLTNALCYLSGESTKATRVCTPIQYASQACARVRSYYRLSLLSGLFRRGQSARNSDRPVATSLLEIHPAVRDSMFYL